MPTIAQLKQQVDRIWVASFQTDLTDTLAAHLRRSALAGVQAALETALLEELEAHRQRERQHNHCASLQRSGTYTRRVLTSHGLISDLHVPKLRGGNAERSWQVLSRYQLAMPLLLDQALYLYSLGLCCAISRRPCTSCLVMCSRARRSTASPWPPNRRWKPGVPDASPTPHPS